MNDTLTVNGESKTMSEELTAQKIDALADALAQMHITASLNSGIIGVTADGRNKPQIHLNEQTFKSLYAANGKWTPRAGKYYKLAVQRGGVEVFCLVDKAKVTA